MIANKLVQSSKKQGAKSLLTNAFRSMSQLDKPKIAYVEELSKHRIKLPLYDLYPRSENAWIAPNATVIGEVMLRRWSSIWYNTVIRGDINKVEIKNFSSVGDNSVVCTAASLPTGMPANVYVGFNVSIGSHCTLYSCHIEDDVFIGDRCIILEGARIEKGAMLAPGTVVPPGRLIPAKQLWAGNPCEYVKDLNVGESWANYTYSYVNAALGDTHKHQFTVWANNYLQKGAAQADVDPTENYKYVIKLTNDSIFSIKLQITYENEVSSAYIERDIYAGMVKHYA